MPIRPLSGTLADETAWYASQGWTSTGATVTPQFNMGALPALSTDLDIHDTSENDDLFQTLFMARRTTGSLQTGYLDRAALWGAYFSSSTSNNYLYQGGGRTGFYADYGDWGSDHVYGWGLVDYYHYTGNVAYLNAARQIGDHLINSGVRPTYAHASCEIGNYAQTPRPIVGDGPHRGFGRQLQLFAELAAADSSYETIRNKYVAILMEDDFYNETLGMWFSSQGLTAATLDFYNLETEAEGVVLHGQGVRYLSMFQPAIVIEGLRRVIETATFPISYTQGATTYGPYSNLDLKDKVIRAAQFWYDKCTHPGRLYTGDTVFFNYNGTGYSDGAVYDRVYGLHGSSPDLTFSDPVYTLCGVNMLMLAAAYIEQTNAADPRVTTFRARAKLLWSRSSQGKRVDPPNGTGPGDIIVWGDGVTPGAVGLGDDRLVLNNQIGVYANATYDSSFPRHFAVNKGSLPYVDLLFANIGVGTGSWAEVSGTNLLTDTSPTWDSGGTVSTGTTALGNQGPSSLYANGGGVYDSTRDQYWTTGGGHANYGGNEAYAFNRSTSTWSRRRNTSPHTTVPDVNYSTYSDGRISAAHKYNGMVYMPNVDRVGLFGHYGIWHAGGGSPVVFWWDPNTDDYVRRDDNPYHNSGTQSISYANYYSGSVYIVGNGQGFLKYTPNLSGADTWSQISTSGQFPQSIYGTSAIDTTRGHFYYFTLGGANLRSFRWNLASANELEEITMSGDLSWVRQYNPGLLYDPVLDKLCLYNQHDPTKLFYMNMSTLEWEAITPTGTPPTVDTDPFNIPYTHNRFLYADGKYIVHIRPTYNIWEYTPSGFVPPPTSPPTFQLSYHGRIYDLVREAVAPTGLTADGTNDHVFSLKLASGEPSVSVSALRLDGQQGGSWRTNTSFWPIGVSQLAGGALQNASNGSVDPVQFDGGDRFFLYVADDVPAVYATTGVTIYITIGSSTYTYTNDMTILPIDPPPSTPTRKVRRIRSS